MFRRILLLVVAATLLIASCSEDDSGTAVDAVPSSTVPDAAVSVDATSSTPAPTTTTTLPPTTTTTTEAVDPTEIVIDVSWTTIDDGPFVASGGAVKAGVMCAGGVSDGIAIETLEETDEKSVFREEIEYVCADGSGSFVLLHDRTWSVGIGFWSIADKWEVLSGTGAYEGMTGSGSGTGDSDTVVSEVRLRGRIEVPAG